MLESSNLWGIFLGNNVEDILKNPYFSLIEGDASQIDFLDSIMAQNETEMVFHIFWYLSFHVSEEMLQMF